MAGEIFQNSISTTDRLLTESEAAELLRWSKKALQQRRWRGVPPPFIKIGGSVRYLERDILAFIATGRSE